MNQPKRLAEAGSECIRAHLWQLSLVILAHLLYCLHNLLLLLPTTANRIGVEAFVSTGPEVPFADAVRDTQGAVPSKEAHTKVDGKLYSLLRTFWTLVIIL